MRKKIKISRKTLILAELVLLLLCLANAFLSYTGTAYHFSDNDMQIQYVGGGH